MKWSPLNKSEKRKGWFIVVVFAAMVAYLVAFSAGAGGWYVCPFNWLTGHSCPGCGMTRATAAFIDGEWPRSFRYHPLGSLFVVGFGFVALRSLVYNLRGEKIILPQRAKTWVDRGWWVALGVVAGFGAIRLGLELAGILTPI